MQILIRHQHQYIMGEYECRMSMKSVGERMQSDLLTDVDSDKEIDIS